MTWEGKQAQTLEFGENFLEEEIFQEQIKMQTTF